MTGQEVEIVTHHTAAGPALGCDVACKVELELVRLGPACVRIRGVEYVLALHEYVIAPAEVERVATVGLVLVDDVARLQIVESYASDGSAALELEIPQARAIVATLWIPAAATTPDRIHRYVVTPASPLVEEQAAQAARTMTPLRPDLTPANRERTAAARARHRVEQELAARRAAPLRAASMTHDDVTALVVLMARAQGLVIP